jgi:hypothetical protein
LDLTPTPCPVIRYREGAGSALLRPNASRARPAHQVITLASARREKKRSVQSLFRAKNPYWKLSDFMGAAWGRSEEHVQSSFDLGVERFSTVGDRQMKFKRGHVAGIGTVWSERPDAEAVFGQPDRCIRSARAVPLRDPNDSICFWVYKYVVVGSWRTLLAFFIILTSSWAEHTSSHSSLLLD